MTYRQRCCSCLHLLFWNIMAHKPFLFSAECELPYRTLWSEAVSVCRGRELQLTHLSTPCRSYYRCNHPCSHSTAKKCTAKKTVQQKDDDPHLLQVAYEGSHSCKAALEFQRGSSTEDPDKAESLNLDDQMSSRANARHNPDPASEWSHIVNPVRTSSGSFSAVSEDGNDQSEEGDGNNSSVSRKDGLGNVHALPEFDIELDIDPIQDWPDCPDFKMFQGTRSYVDQTDIIEDHAKVLLENIMRPCSPGFQFGAIDTLNDIQNWHGHYRWIFKNIFEHSLFCTFEYNIVFFKDGKPTNCMTKHLTSQIRLRTSWFSIKSYEAL